MDRLTLALSDPVQAHKTLTMTVWPLVKASLIAGRRMTVEVKPETRSLQANARMWAMLAEISKQVDWHGRRLTATAWKHVFTAALTKQDVVPGIDGGFVVLGKETSKMTRAEMSELQELMEAFGAQQGVKFSAPMYTEGESG